MARTLREIEEQMAEHGIYVPPGYELVVNNGTKFERFKPADSRWKRSKEVWYVLFEHHTQSGKLYYAGKYGIADEQYLVEMSRNNSFTAEEKKEVEEKREENRKKIEAMMEDQRKVCKDKALRLWNAAADSVSASLPYIVKKGIRPIGARQLRNQLLIPMYQIDLGDPKKPSLVMVSLQIITEAETDDGGKEIKKVFLTGTPKKGSFSLLAPPGTPEYDTVYVCEGWATGCSIYQATQKPVYVAFDAGNLDSVIASIKQIEKAKIVIAADNDCHYHTKLKNDFKAKYGVDLEIGASRSSPAQLIETPSGQVTVKAYWGSMDGETCVYYSEKTPGQKQAIRRNALNTGVFKATLAAIKHRCGLVVPKFKDPKKFGTDFNDLVSEEGIEIAREQLSQITDPRDRATTTQEKRERRAKEKAIAASQAARIVRELGQTYIHIYPEDVCWDLKEKLLVKIGVLRQCYESKLVTAYLTNAYGNLKRIRKDQLVFRPDGVVPPGCVNTFTGWKTTPDPNASCDKLISHLFLICEEDENVFDWVLKWLAYPIQHPGAKMHTALVVFGEREGTGKSMFFDAVSRIYGREYSRHVDQKLMTSRFNMWLSHKLFVVADEVVTSKERRELKGILKNLITSPVHQLEEKNMPVVEEDNLTNFVYLSNEMQPLALDWFDRRYMCIRYNAELPPQYFKELAEEIENGGVNALCHYLMHVDLTGFEPSTRPIETQATRDLKELGTDSGRRFLLEWLNEETPFLVGPASSQDLYRAYLLWLPSAGERQQMTSKMFGLTASSMMIKREKIRAVVYDHEYSIGSTFDNDKQIKEKRLTVYFPNKTEEEMLANPPERIELSQQLRKFQESLYYANRRQRNYGHI